MGIDPRQLSPRAQQLVRDAERKQKARRAAAAAPVPASGTCAEVGADSPVALIFLHLDMVPPTVTHHDKELAPRRKAGGGYRMTLQDSPALRAVRDLYLARIPVHAGPPLTREARISICFAWQPVKPSDPPAGSFWPNKPDWDNAAKALCDALVDRGYLERDERIVDGRVIKLSWFKPFITIALIPAGQMVPQGLLFEVLPPMELTRLQSGVHPWIYNPSGDPKP